MEDRITEVGCTCVNGMWTSKILRWDFASVVGVVPDGRGDTHKDSIKPHLTVEMGGH